MRDCVMSKSSEDVLLVVSHVKNKKCDGTLYMMSERMAWMPSTKESFTISYNYVDIKGNLSVLVFIYLYSLCDSSEMVEIPNMVVVDLPKYTENICLCPICYGKIIQKNYSLILSLIGILMQEHGNCLHKELLDCVQYSHSNSKSVLFGDLAYSTPVKINYFKKTNTRVLVCDFLCKWETECFQCAWRFGLFVFCIAVQKISPDTKDKVQLQVVLQQGGANSFHFANPAGRTKQVEERDSVKELLQQLLPRFRHKMNADLEEKNRSAVFVASLSEIYNVLDKNALPPSLCNRDLLVTQLFSRM